MISFYDMVKPHNYKNSLKIICDNKIAIDAIAIASSGVAQLISKSPSTWPDCIVSVSS